MAEDGAVKSASKSLEENINLNSLKDLELGFLEADESGDGGLDIDEFRQLFKNVEPDASEKELTQVRSGHTHPCCWLERAVPAAALLLSSRTLLLTDAALPLFSHHTLPTFLPHHRPQLFAKIDANADGTVDWDE